MNALSHMYTPLTFRHHWLAYWKPFVGIGLLAALGTAAMFLWMPLGLALNVLAILVGLATYCSWAWHTIAFTDDNRLIYRHGPFGVSHSFISLIGTVTTHQVPLLGQWLDVGSVHLGVPGPDTTIRYIAHFSAFCRRLAYSRSEQRGSERVSVQVNVLGVPVPHVGYGQRTQLPTRESVQFPVYPLTAVHEEHEHERVPVSRHASVSRHKEHGNRPRSW